jgi:hypothetical protein
MVIGFGSAAYVKPGHHARVRRSRAPLPALSRNSGEDEALVAHLELEAVRVAVEGAFL